MICQVPVEREIFRRQRVDSRKVVKTFGAADRVSLHELNKKT